MISEKSTLRWSIPKGSGFALCDLGLFEGFKPLAPHMPLTGTGTFLLKGVTCSQIQIPISYMVHKAWTGAAYLWQLNRVGRVDPEECAKRAVLATELGLAVRYNERGADHMPIMSLPRIAYESYQPNIIDCMPVTILEVFATRRSLFDKLSAELWIAADTVRSQFL